MCLYTMTYRLLVDYRYDFDNQTFVVFHKMTVDAVYPLVVSFPQPNDFSDKHLQHLL